MAGGSKGTGDTDYGHNLPPFRTKATNLDELWNMQFAIELEGPGPAYSASWWGSFSRANWALGVNGDYVLGGRFAAHLSPSHSLSSPSMALYPIFHGKNHG